MRIFVSPSAAERLARARDVVRGSAPGSRLLVVGASRGAADDLVREVAATVPATFGIQRLSLTQLAARTALVALAADGTTPSTGLGAEAVATRAVFDATRDEPLGYFAPVATTPGFPLQRMDPLTRGSLFHEIQAKFLRALKERKALPVTEAHIDEARIALDAAADAVAMRAYDELAPAVDRVWNDAIVSIRRDLHGWLHALARDGDQWLPALFEFAFGSVPGELAPRRWNDAIVSIRDLHGWHVRGTR